MKNSTVQKLNFTLTESTLPDDIFEESCKTYGFSVAENGEAVHTFDDLCLEKEKVEKLIDELNSLEIELASLDDIVENFLIDFEA